MEKNWIPCLQYPTEIILIDDNKNFLKTLTAALGNRFRCRAFEDPKQALQYISETVNRIGITINKYIPEVAEDIEIHQKGLVINLSDIHKEIYNMDRFKEISVVVVDYGMPSMNGLELCKKIREIVQAPIKIIMLTGEADYELAVQAFNDGLIDKFILKSKTNYVTELGEAIQVLREKYFIDLSKPVYRSLQAATQKLLENKAFVDLLKSILDENKSSEFYILDDSFSILFLDEKGENPIWLVMKTEEDVDMQYELASNEKNAPTDKVNAIKNKEKFAYFVDEDGINEPATNWKLCEAKPLGDKNSGFYYAILKGKDSFPLNKGHIASYNQYLKTK